MTARRSRRALVVVLGVVAVGLAGLSLWGVWLKRRTPMLEAFEAVARRETRSEFRAAALVELAWAEVETGNVETARDLAREARRKGIADAPQGSRTAARLAAVLERTERRGAGRELFDAALRPLEAGFGSEEHEAAIVWFDAIGHSPGAVDSQEDALVGRAFALVEKGDDGLFGAEAARGLAVLGGAERVRELALRRLEKNRSWSSALAAIDSRCALPAPLSDKVLESAATKPEELLEGDAVDRLVPALRARYSPWETAATLAADLEASGHRGEANVARLAGLIRLAELDERSSQGDRVELVLDAALAEALPQPRAGERWERVRVLTRVLSLVPSFELGERGIELVRRSERQAAAAVPGEGERVLLECVVASHRLTPRREARALEEECGRDALAAWVALRKGRPIDVTGRLRRCVLASAVRLGSERGKALLEEVVRDLVPRVNDEAEPSALIECASAAGRLGDHDQARRLFEQSLALRVHQTRGTSWELIVAIAATKGLDRDLRDEVAGRVIQELAHTEMTLDEWRSLFAAVAAVERSPVGAGD